MGLKQLQEIRANRDKPREKKKYSIPKKSAKKLKQEAEEKELQGGNPTELDIWFAERRKELKGKCDFCGGKTEKFNNETYRFSIAHLLAKREAMFPSVATHPANYLELCYYGNSCHTNFDNSIITWELLKDSKEWDLIVGKFKEIYPFIDQCERKNIPSILLNEI